MEGDVNKVTRRAVIKAAAAAALAGCNMSGQDNNPSVEPAQRAQKSQGRSRVAIVRAASYEEDIAERIKALVPDLSLPRLDGKTIVIKPNMVEFHPDKPIHTDPAMIAVAAEVARELGAREIIVAEGPGHMRDTEFLLEATGIGRACSKLGLRFVDLNLDQLAKVENRHGFTRLDHFYLPKTIVEADAVLSLPKLKTHHWVGMTASMKNLFGVIPGRRYGWPKNVLHVEGIHRSIMDVVRLTPTRLAIVDAVVAMEGDGPVNGTAVRAGFVAVGSDLAAVDSTCARAMGLDPLAFPYLRLAGEVIGNINLAAIQLFGTPVDEIKRAFAMPVTFPTEQLLRESARQSS